MLTASVTSARARAAVSSVSSRPAGSSAKKGSIWRRTAAGTASSSMRKST